MIVIFTRLGRDAWTFVGRYVRVFGSLCLNLRRLLSVCVWAAMFELALAAICVCLGRYVCVVVGVKCQGVNLL